MCVCTPWRRWALINWKWKQFPGTVLQTVYRPLAFMRSAKCFLFVMKLYLDSWYGGRQPILKMVSILWSSEFNFKNCAGIFMALPKIKLKVCLIHNICHFKWLGGADYTVKTNIAVIYEWVVKVLPEHSALLTPCSAQGWSRTAQHAAPALCVRVCEHSVGRAPPQCFTVGVQMKALLVSMHIHTHMHTNMNTHLDSFRKRMFEVTPSSWAELWP